MIYLNSKYIFIDNAFYEPDSQIEVKQVNNDFEEKTLFASYLKKELSIFKKLIQNYKK